MVESLTMNIDTTFLTQQESHIVYRIELIPSNQAQTKALVDYANALENPERIEIIEDLIGKVVNNRAEAIKEAIKPDWYMNIEMINHVTFHVHLRDPKLSTE